MRCGRCSSGIRWYETNHYCHEDHYYVCRACDWKNGSCDSCGNPYEDHGATGKARATILVTLIALFAFSGLFVPSIMNILGGDAPIGDVAWLFIAIEIVVVLLLTILFSYLSHAQHRTWTRSHPPTDTVHDDPWPEDLEWFKGPTPAKIDYSWKCGTFLVLFMTIVASIFLAIMNRTGGNGLPVSGVMTFFIGCGLLMSFMFAISGDFRAIGLGDSGVGIANTKAHEERFYRWDHLLFVERKGRTVYFTERQRVQSQHFLPEEMVDRIMAHWNDRNPMD